MAYFLVRNKHLLFHGHLESKIFQTLHDCNLAWGLYIVILGLMTLTLFQGHRYVRNINCKLCVLVLVFCNLIVVWLVHTLNRLCTIWFAWCWWDNSREIINMFFISQVSGLAQNFDMGIYSHTVNVINVKLCMMVLLLELYLFIPLSVTLTIFQGHSNVKLF